MKKMEILSPASNMTHIDMAIEEKVDAVYGGLQNWNARNRLINFSLEEYSRALIKLHENNIKFYLTLNVLMLDEEIEEVISLFKSKQITLPDAFIVQDVGLAIVLKREFPEVELHFSTQFGAHNKSDLEFIEALDGSRAIIARELNYKELEELSKDSNIELEVFVHGFQCMSYSGLCLWGSLLNNGSGNRGKCLTLCRDLYSNEEMEGNLLYKPTLDCISMVEKFKNIDSLKIEGRRRSAEDIRKVVRMIKKKESSKKAGHIFGESIKENNLFEMVHFRIKPLYKYNELPNINKNDIFVDFDENSVPIRFTKQINSNSYYVYSQIKNKYLFEKKNISFEFIIEGNIIKRINYLSNKGNSTFFVNNKEPSKLKEVRTEEFLELLIKNMDVNIYKILYNRNKEDIYYIDIEFLEEIQKFLSKNLLKDEFENVEKYTKRNANKKIELFVESKDVHLLKRLINNKQIKLIFNIDTKENLKNIDNYINELGNSVIYKLPLFNWTSEDLKPYYAKLENCSVMFTRWAQIFQTKDLKFKEKLIDYTVYVWNDYSLKYLKNNNIDVFTASPELSFSKNCDILENSKKQFILAGEIPLMYSRMCFKHIFDCKTCNKLENKKVYNEDKKLEFKIKCTDDYRYLICKNPILNDYTDKDYENVSFRYIVGEQNIEEVEQTINIILKKPDNYYEELRHLKSWKDSYQGNVNISRY